jgi:hypothetical protein
MSQSISSQSPPVLTQKDVRNKATKAAASWFGVIAGLLGIEHSIFEMLQGSVTPSRVLMHAFGSPCQPDQALHACEPAMTLIPNRLVTGIFAIIFSFSVVIWVTTCVHRKYGGVILLGLAFFQLVVGEGFIPIPIIIAAGLVGTRIDVPLTWWRGVEHSIFLRPYGHGH